ncbi:MAG: hypothetical protein M3O78_06430 [Chloroflexota bacterium]|nr:hypothetical protein [Chloroflexota bacterium]
MRRPMSVRPAALAALLSVAMVSAGCAPSASSPSTTPTPGSRPSSPAVVTILQPTPNQVITGSSVHVVLSLKNARIVPQTSTTIRPDEGHVHLYVDNVLFSMNYQLEQDLPVHPGTYVLKAEFVAADHAPFNPRIVSPEVVFVVH